MFVTALKSARSLVSLVLARCVRRPTTLQRTARIARSAPVATAGLRTTWPRNVTSRSAATAIPSIMRLVIAQRPRIGPESSAATGMSHPCPSVMLANVHAVAKWATPSSVAKNLSRRTRTLVVMRASATLDSMLLLAADTGASSGGWKDADAGAGSGHNDWEKSTPTVAVGGGSSW